MILKSYQISKINLLTNNIILFYGKNDGLKDQAINQLIKNENEIFTYEEKEILDNENIFFENIFAGSLFESRKSIVIKRATEKILKIIQEILDKKDIQDITIIICAENLQKNSKLRIFFEKSKHLIIIPFYPDDEAALSQVAYAFLKERNISISRSNINMIVSKCNGDRKNLLNELNKIENYIKNGKKIDEKILTKLINIVEDYSISELVDSCLAKNQKQTINILNENNFTNEDCILITRTFLSKSKRILKLSSEYENNNNIELTISSAKPPIFWKDKEITKQQIFKWSPQEIRKLIYNLNELEFNVKKNINFSINLITDFILKQTTSKTNN